MILRHSKRTVPQLNTTSTADISFILLVFFLVMTSMDVDKGLSRVLPPIQNDNETEVTEVAKSDVLTIRLTADSRLVVDGQPMETGKLRCRVVTFISRMADSRRHILLLDVDRRASYDLYFNVQNEIVGAYNALRDGYARRQFGRAYALCTPRQRDEARKYYPQRISETTAGEKEGGGI